MFLRSPLLSFTINSVSLAVFLSSSFPRPPQLHCRYSESRRALIISFLLVLALLYYFAPWFMSHGTPRHTHGDASATCLAERVSRYQSDMDHFDAALHRHQSNAASSSSSSPSTDGKPTFFPFVGNGLLAISPDVSKERELYLRAPGSDVVALKVRVRWLLN